MRLRLETYPTWIYMLLRASLAGAACGRLEMTSKPV
jgi:hypothetical protein